MRYLVGVIGLVLACSLTARAERRFEKKEDATLVVTGKVLRVYSKDSKYGGDGVFTNYILEIQVGAVDKGTGPKAGEVIYARCSRPTKAPSVPIPGPSGHRNIPKDGDEIKVYLMRQADGGFEVVYPDGVEQVDKKK